MSNNFPLESGQLEDFELHKPKVAKPLSLDTMSEKELLTLRGEVESRLKGTRLIDINLTKETLLQLKLAKILQVEVNKPDTEVPANQRAQVQNSLASIVSTLSKLQIALYDSESAKRLKAAVIRIVKKLPKAQQDEFFEMMEMEIDQIEAEMQDAA